MVIWAKVQQVILAIAQQVFWAKDPTKHQGRGQIGYLGIDQTGHQGQNPKSIGTKAQ
jgi:hypothetical protein